MIQRFISSLSYYVKILFVLLIFISVAIAFLLIVFLRRVGRAEEPIFPGPERKEAVLPEEDKRRFEGAYIFYKALKEPFKIDIPERNVFLRPGIYIPTQEKPTIPPVEFIVLDIRRIAEPFKYAGHIEKLEGVLVANISNVIGLRPFLSVGDSFSLRGEPETVFKIEKITRERVVAVSNKGEELILNLGQPIQRDLFVADIKSPLREIFENRKVGDIIEQGKIVDIQENSVAIEINGQRHRYSFVPAPVVPIPVMMPPGVPPMMMPPGVPPVRMPPGVPPMRMPPGMFMPDRHEHLHMPPPDMYE